MANVMLVEGWGLAGTITDDLGPETPPTLAALGWTVTNGSSRDATLSIREGAETGQSVLGAGASATTSSRGFSLCRYAGLMEGDVVIGFSAKRGAREPAYYPGLFLSDSLISGSSDAKYYITLRSSSDGNLYFYAHRANDISVGVTALDTSIAGAENWFECVFRRSQGSVEFWLNNRLVATLDAPAELLPLTHVAAATSAFGPGYSSAPSGNTTDLEIGALYVADERLGRCQVITRRPTSDAAVEFSRPQGDSNASQVADPSGADGDTTYVSSSTSGAEDLYASSDTVDLTNERIHAVAVTTTARKEDVGNRSITPIVGQGVAVAAGEPATLQIETYVGTQSTFSVDPATGTNWTINGVQSSTFGARLTD